MDMHEILTIARCFSDREWTDGEACVLLELCREAERYWRGKLRENVEPEDCRGAFLTACAWTALAALNVAAEAGAGSVRSFSAGDLSVQMGSTGSRTAGRKSMLAQAELLMAPYTADSGFAFLEVAG